MRAALAGFSGALAVQLGETRFDWITPGHYADVLRIGAPCAGVVAHCHPEALPLDESAVDLVLLIHVLDNAPAPAAVLAEAARILRGEGRLVVVFRHRPATLAEIFALGAGRRGFLGRRQLCRLVEAAGLEWRGGAEFSPRRRHGKPRACLPLGYASCAATAVKRVAGLRMIKPAWKDCLARRRKVLQEHGQTS